MKIGLLTYHAACNFGANLQALSTVSYWKEHGYDPVFINWMTKDLEEYYLKNTPEEQFDTHKKFREQFFPLTRECFTDEEIASVINDEDIEAVVVGSDAVMKTNPIRSRYRFPTRKIVSVYHPTTDSVCPNPFWGSYYHLLKRNIPLCYMSASSQNSPYKSSNKEERKLAKDLLSKYSYISTRDDWTSKMVEWYMDGAIKPSVTPDPVFAFNYNVKSQPSEEEIRKRFGLDGDYCLFSFHSDRAVNMEWLQNMKVKMQERGVTCVAFPFPQGINFKHPFDKEIGLPLSPIDWYALIKYAYAYIGENMHPIVVCLHNSVPCFSFDNYGIIKYHFFVNEKSSKIYHILNRFGLIGNRSPFYGKYTQPTTDYVLEKLEGYDKKHVKNVAEELFEAYKRMMADIEKAIKEFK